MANDVRGYDIPQRLAFFLPQTLKSYAGDFPGFQVQDRPPAVARVDGRVDLDAKKTRPAMGIPDVFYTGDNAARVGNVRAAAWIADGLYEAVSQI